MPFQLTLLPQMRDSDPDGLIGLRGVMRNFQNIHQWYMHRIHKGNDELPKAYGAAWIYTRYHVTVDEKIDHSSDIRLTAWMEPYRRPVLVTMDMLVEQHGRIAARGKIESCVFHLAGQHPMMLGEIDFPENMPEEAPEEIPDYIGLGRNADGMEERYLHTVRYADVDQNQHMANLRYIEMFQNAHDKAFWDRLEPRQMEISFFSQCREGETLSVRSRVGEGSVALAAVHADGRIAAAAAFTR